MVPLGRFAAKPLVGVGLGDDGYVAPIDGFLQDFLVARHGEKSAVALFGARVGEAL